MQFTHIILTFPPNVMAEWSVLPLHVCKVYSSYLGLETGYPDRFLVDLLHPSGQILE
jgi:hypothetical protein